MSDSETITITVNDVNQPPVAVDDPAATDEDVAFDIDVLANDTDPDPGDQLQVNGVTQPANGAVSINPDGTVKYTPNTDFNGADSFDYTTADNSGATDTGTVTVTVNPVNDAPVLAAIGDQTVDEGATLSVPLSATDVDGDALAFGSTTLPGFASITDNGDGTGFLDLSPAFSNGGSYLGVAIEVSDGSDSDSETITINVVDVNQPPVAVDDPATTDEDLAADIAVLANDSDPDGDPLTVVSVTQPADGTASVNPDGTVSYAPNPDFNGSDSFDYTVEDEAGNQATATVSVTMNAVNDAPVADPLATATPEDVVLALTLTGSDVDGDAITFSLVAQPATGGTVSLQADGSATFTPQPDFFGQVTFQFRVFDGVLYSQPATVTIDVTPVNDAPVAVDDNATTDEDTAVDIDAAGNDSDVEGDALTVTAVSDPPKGTASVNQNGTVHYLPDPDFNGTDTFAYTIQDPSGASATGTVTVTVNPVNDPPLLAAIGDQQLSEGDVVDVDVSATDPDGTTPSLSASGLPAFANLIDNGNGTGVIQLAPGLGDAGDYPATITATDDVGLTDVETFTISVVPAGAGSDLACLTGSDLVTIGRDADVMCDILSGGKFRLYHGSRRHPGLVDASITARGDGFIQKFNHITGDVTLGGRLKLPRGRFAHTVVIDGEVTEYADVPPVVLPPVHLAVEPDRSHRVHVRHGKSVNLPPNDEDRPAYGILKAGHHSKVVLHSGVYYFERFVMMHHSQLVIKLHKGEPITINIHKGLHMGHHTRVKIRGGEPRRCCSKSPVGESCTRSRGMTKTMMMTGGTTMTTDTAMTVTTVAATAGSGIPRLAWPVASCTVPSSTARYTRRRGRSAWGATASSRGPSSPGKCVYSATPG